MYNHSCGEMLKMKILVNTPDYTKPSSGGVASFYHGMLGYWTEDVRYNVVGRRHGISGAFWMPWDILKFIVKVLVCRPDCIVVNPSLKINALRRDFMYIDIAVALKLKVVVIMHGFDLGIAQTVNKEWVRQHLDKASLVLTLAAKFREIMRSWMVKSPIELTTTKVEDRMLDGFDIKSRQGKIRNILFLSRVEKAKGVYEMIDTFLLLKRKKLQLTLTVVGGGSELDSLERYANEKKVEGITFMGEKNGRERIEAYKNADLFFFPSYGEGMPTVVLEAMAFGLPVVTRYVGGLCDFFEDGKMGRITDSKDPCEFAGMIETFLHDEEYTKQVSSYNHEYALQHFMASKVGVKIEELIKHHIK